MIFGLSETALGVGKSLGREGINVYGISHQKEIGYYSKYIKGALLPHPVIHEADFIKLLRKFCLGLNKKPVLFITSDEYLTFYTKNSDLINKHFYSNLPDADLVKALSDKYIQYVQKI